MGPAVPRPLVVAILLALVACAGSPEPDGTREFTLRVLDPEGRPLTDVGFHRHEPAAHDVIREFGSATLEGEAFRIRLKPGIDLAIPLSVGSEHGRIKIPLPPPGTDEVTVRFRAAGTIDLAVRGVHGDTWQYLVFVEAAREGLSDGYFEGALHPDDGLPDCRFQPGEYEISIVRHPQGYDPLVLERVRIDSGVNRLAYRLPETFDLTVLLPDEARGRFVAAWSASGTPVDADHEREDRFEFLGLVPGTYTFFLEGDEQEDAMLVDVRSSGLVEYRPSRITALRVNLLAFDPDEDPLAKAGLRQGDLVVAIGGTGFLSWPEVQSRVDAAATAPEVALIVLRKTAHVELSVAGPLLKKYLGLGGYLIPTVR